MSLLFRRIEDLQDVVVIPSDFPLEKISPQLLACQRFVARFTGEALIERLTTKIQTQTDLSPLERKLLQLIAVPVANLALFRFANVRNVKLTDQGVFRTQTGNSSDAFEWQLERMLAQQESDAWEGLEELHRFLEANRDSFEEYTESEAFKADQLLLIRSATVFNHFYFISDSRLTFYALLPAMRQAQIRKIEPVLGTVFDTLLTADTLTAEQIKILYLARMALAHATMARAIREHIVHVGPAGVQVMAVRSFAQDNYKSTPDQKSIEKAVTYHESECDSTLEALASLVAPPTPEPGTGSGSGTGVRGGNGLISF